MLVANMMPKFALNQMQNRGEESISPVSFHSNSSSSSNVSYPKRYLDCSRDGGEAYGNRYYYNKYNKYDENGGSRIIYKTTSNAYNGNNIRFLKKAYNSKYENQEGSTGLISNKNILENSSRIITAADHRNLKKTIDLTQDDKIKKDDDEEKKSSSDVTNNNEKKKAEKNGGEANATVRKNDLKNLPDDITNHLDDMFNNLNMSQLLPEKLTDERESSRFSKWFSVNKDEEKADKIPDLQNNNNDDVAFPQSVESEKYFQPIDKVETNSLFRLLKGPGDCSKDDNALMNMIHQKQQKSPNSGQVHSVEELEARLRQHKVTDEHKNNDNEQKVLQNFFHQQLMPNMQHPQQQLVAQNQEDVNAFKKLLSQMTSDESKQNGPNVLQQMISHGGEGNQHLQRQKGLPIAGKMQSSMINPNPVAQHVIPHQQYGSNSVDIMKFMQQQQQKIPIGQHSDVMTRPEVQAIVQGKTKPETYNLFSLNLIIILELSTGEIAQYTLWQRLTTPGMSHIERDIITSALNVFNANSNASGNNSAMFPKTVALNNHFSQMKTNTLSAPIPMPQGSPLSPVPPSMDQHLLFQHQAAAAAANKLRVSPLPAAGKDFF